MQVKEKTRMLHEQVAERLNDLVTLATVNETLQQDLALQTAITEEHLRG